MNKEDCRLCRIPNTEKLYFIDEDVFVCDTRTPDGSLRLDGSKHRIMAVTRNHTSDITEELKKHAIEALINVGKGVFRGLCWAVTPASCRTEPHHWHIIARDVIAVFGENKKWIGA